MRVLLKEVWVGGGTSSPGVQAVATVDVEDIESDGGDGYGGYGDDDDGEQQVYEGLYGLVQPPDRR